MLVLFYDLSFLFLSFSLFLFLFFFNDTATTEIYTLSLHDALPIFNAAFTSYVLSYLTCVLEAQGIEKTMLKKPLNK